MPAKIEVIIMCKAPVTGRVKTRLMPVYSAEEACSIHMAMATTVVKRAIRLFPKVTIAADDPLHQFFKQFEFPIVEQGEGDLGERMSRLMVDAFNGGADAVMFLGTDSPHMAESRLQKAVEALLEHDVVLGPVEDGGYDLIAMSKAYHELFEGIRWGSEQVFDETIRQAERLELKTGLLDVSFDLDTAQSLERAANLWRTPALHLQGTASGS